jgi:hypothetical protein
MYDPVVQYVRDPSNMSGVRSDDVQQRIDRAKAAPAWYWTAEHVSILTKHIKDADIFRQMLADANAARDVAKASYFTAIAESTAKAVASAIATAGQPAPPVVAPTTLPATIVVSSETATVSATTIGAKSQSQRSKMALKPPRAPARSKKTLSERPQLVLSPKSPVAQKSAGGGPVAAASKKSAEEGKSPLTPTPTPDPHHRSSRANLDQFEGFGSSDDDFSTIGSFSDDDSLFNARKPSSVHNSARKLVSAALAGGTSSADVEQLLVSARSRASGLTNLAPSTFLAMLVLGQGFLLVGFTNGVHMLTAKVDAKKRMTFKVKSLQGPHGSPPLGPAVDGEGRSLRLIPWNSADVPVQFALARWLATGALTDSDPAMAARTLRDQALYDQFVAVFTTRALHILGTDGWVTPWAGHPHRCSLFLWVILWLIFHRTITHTMVTKGDPSFLLETLEHLMRLATQSNLFPQDPGAIQLSELHAACKLLGLRCEGCNAAGFATVACPSCSSLPRGDSYEGPAYYQARDAWKGKDKARSSLSATELNKQFKQSAEGKEFQASLVSTASGAASGSSKAVTAEACMVYVRKNQNKLPAPLEPPTVTYK